MARGGGRGEYYRNKYGGGGRGRGRASGGRGARGGDSSNHQRSNRGPNGGTYTDLLALLQKLDGRQYPSYHDLETGEEKAWLHSTGFTLQIGRTQADPFAPSTRCRVVLPALVNSFPPHLIDEKIGRIARADFLWRRLHQACRWAGADQALQGSGWVGPKGGDL